MTRNLIAGLLVGVAVSLFFGTVPVHAQSNPLRGEIKGVTVLGKGDILGMVLVNKEAWVYISKQTKIFKLDGKERKVAKWEDLKSGLQIVATWSGGVNDSCPPQVQADEVVIQGEKKPDFRGTIAMASAGKGKDLLGSLLVEGSRGQTRDKAWIHITKDTKIFKLDGKDRKAATFEDLKVGVRVDARFVGVQLPSNPPQEYAAVIVILASEKN